MSIRLAEENEIFLSTSYDSPDRNIHIHGHNAIKWFSKLIHRGMNTWDEAPHEIKAFADQFIHGQELQDYGILDPKNTIDIPPK
jgi:hypothetical protein